MARARIVIADDHPLVVESVTQLLEPTFAVVGTARTGHEVIEAATTLHPDIVFLDANMPEMGGFDAAKTLKRVLPLVRIIFVTMRTDAVAVSEAFRAGATGYVLKQDAAEELLAAVHSVLLNRRYVSAQLSLEIRDVIEADWSRPEGYTAHLTERQRQILVLLANGGHTKQIAEELHISMKTVEFHKANLARKLGVHTTSELIRFALAAGLTTL
ncbi:MAG: response regulator transcription factor [Nitrospira sp.]|nr:response regulator transcription factor [Nitrospira sp.]